MADAAKALFNSTKCVETVAKDKLAAKKQHEREVHDRLKQAQRDKKEEGKGKKLEAKALLKEERVLHDTKRAHTDMRHQKHRAEHKETGQMCEHGVWRCKICFPHADRA
ncbi:hypothetical protein D9Q98_004882 [Chlorella vulgaris]|uniref:Uncharacterized protein n=1 Tax=Chlorella vulgaris TaxID=3077 RepID=A0A9D4YWG4_CHLVU|nr:hypothetical protein D9Q98_004882 [Chlorella vulgaris]